MVAKKDQGRGKLNKGKAGGRPELDDSAIIEAVALLLARDEWSRQRVSARSAPVLPLDPTNAIRQAINASCDIYGDGGTRDYQITSAIPRILGKLREIGESGQTVLDAALDQARKKQDIFGGPAVHSLLTTPPPPAATSDIALINEFVSAVAQLQVVARGLERQKYRELSNDIRSEIRSFLTAFKKLGI